MPPRVMLVLSDLSDLFDSRGAAETCSLKLYLKTMLKIRTSEPGYLAAI